MKLRLRPLLPGETDWENFAAWATPSVALAGVVWIKINGPVLPCTFKHLTGHPCCGCGATRAAKALSEGHVGAAFLLNPLATALAIALLAHWIYAMACLGGGANRRLRPDTRHPKLLLSGALLAVLANWIWVLLHLPESPWKIG